MTNPISALFNEAREMFILSVIVIVALIILGTLATIPGAPSEAKAAATQGQDTISYIWILYLGLPSIGVIVAIIWLISKFTNRSYQY